MKTVWCSLHEQLATLGFRRPRFLRGQRIEAPLSAPVIHTPRLILRPHRVSDEEEWYAIESDPNVLKYLSWPCRDRARSLQHLKDRTKHNRLVQANDLLALAIESDGHLVGDVSLHLRTVQAEHRSAEIGWVLASAYTGKGFATEASNAMLDLAFGALKVRRVSAIVNEQNRRSLATAARLGFVEIRRMKSDVVLMIAPDRRNAQPGAEPHAGGPSVT